MKIFRDIIVAWKMHTIYTMTERNWVDILNAVPSVKYSENGVTRWDVKENVHLEEKNLTKLPLQFGIVTGHFYCYDNQLITLEGAPREVGGGFYCVNNQLTNLIGSPQKVGGSFSCHSNKLKSLEGLPTYIGGNTYFYNNPLEHLNDLNDLNNIQIKGEICIYENDFDSFIKALQNTDLHILEYTLSNHRYRFDNDEIEKDFLMYIEQIIIKKRLELILV